MNKLAKREILRIDLEVHMEKYKKLVSSNYLFGSFYQTLLILTCNNWQAERVYAERAVLAIHEQIAMDTLNMSYERYLMSSEEIRTMSYLISIVETRSRTTSNIEWLKKIIRATQIQLKEDESCLVCVEKMHSSLKSSLSAKRR